MPTKTRIETANPPVQGHRRIRRCAGGLAATLAAFGLAAGPAAAGHEFEDAFEDELGRIAARHFAQLGELVFWGGRVPVVERVHVEKVHVVKHRARRHFHGPRCGHPQRYRGHHRHHHGHKPWHHARPWHRKHHPHPHHGGDRERDRTRHHHEHRDHGGDAYGHHRDGRRGGHEHARPPRRDRRERDRHA